MTIIAGFSASRHGSAPINAGDVVTRASHDAPVTTPNLASSPAPADLIRAWPSDQPLGVVYRAGDHDVSRRTLLVKPRDTRFVFAPREPDSRGAAPLDEIERTWASTRKPHGSCWATEPCEAIGQGWLTALS
mgnify:CR=1 FL=1